MGSLGAAIWGAGSVSTEHIRSYVANPHCEVRAIGSRTRASAESKRDMFGLDCAIYTDYEEFLADSEIDVFSICTPAENHSREAILGAEAGKHMLIEKPVATSFEELRAMDRAVREAGVKTVVSFVLHWNEMITNLKTLIAAGALGEVFYVQTDYWHPLWVRGKDGAWEQEQTSMLQGGCHAVDMARYLMESDIVSVTALGVDVNPNNVSNANMTTLVEFANGRIGKVSCIGESRMPYVFNVEVFGSEGTFRNGHLYSHLTPAQNDWIYVPSIEPDSADVEHHPFQGQIDHLIECILEDKDSHVDLRDAVNTHEACLAAEVSIARDNEKVRLPYEG